ncbi:MAG: hypothetical protein IKJ36_04430 [Clostridia bacterium]|nr:hypothetical protein [Clostridia bacterium]
MDEYRKILILQYFYDVKEKYDINELIRKMGINIEILFGLIDELIESQLLIYQDFLLKITEEGTKNLTNNEIYSLYGNKIINNNFIDVNNKLNVQDIYIPKRFTKKI